MLALMESNLLVVLKAASNRTAPKPRPHSSNMTVCSWKNVHTYTYIYPLNKRDDVKGSISGKTVRAVDLATQSAGASSWLTV